jgi:hypothetical protein
MMSLLRQISEGTLRTDKKGESSSAYAIQFLAVMQCVYACAHVCVCDAYMSCLHTKNVKNVLMYPSFALTGKQNQAALKQRSFW